MSPLLRLAGAGASQLGRMSGLIAIIVPSANAVTAKAEARQPITQRR